MTTEEMIAVMQAYVAGKEVQAQGRRSSGENWLTFTNRERCDWDWYSNKYRIKPREPRNFHLALDKHGNPLAIGNVGGALAFPRGSSVKEMKTVIHVREVIE